MELQDFYTIETHVSIGEKRWLKWINEAEKIIGHSLDGDEEVDGFSYDFAYCCFEEGDSPSNYVENVKSRNMAYEAEED
jgi:hypothetical protein